jgi:hypothetical protein
MSNTIPKALALAGLLLICICIAGCSDEAPPADVPGVPTAAQALYSAGDIVKNPKSSAGAALLITGYDPVTDMYERAYIYPNSDGNWGYRIDASTDSIRRSVIEQVYTEKIRTVTVSAVPIGTPAAVTPAETSVTTATTVPTSTTVTTTTTTGQAPRIKNVEPDKGKTATTVSITNLQGENFRTGAIVTFKKSGETSLNLTDMVITSDLITGKLIIPAGTKTGYWDVLVTNKDGTHHQYQNGFNVLEGTATTTTTSSAQAAANVVKITQIQDPLLVTGGAGGYKTVSILGTNLTAAYGMKLNGMNTIVSNAYNCASSTMCTGYFNIPGGSGGSYTVSLVDLSNTVLTTSSETLTIQ